MSTTALNLERWVQVKPLLMQALDHEGPDRAAYLDQACADDSDLRNEIEQYLTAYDRDHTRLEPAARSAAGMDPLIGQKIGQFTVIRLIGCGGMGAVYEAEQAQPKRIVALKLMRAGIASRSAQRRFEFESQMLARLHHPGIAQVHEAGTYNLAPGPVGTIPYFAMEFVDGGVSIVQYALDKQLVIRQRLELFAHVCDAVHHGHQNGVIHRDLKPANILVDRQGQPKIIDFGIARAINSDATLLTAATTAGQIVGTLQYMAPEQFAAHCGDSRAASSSPADGVDIRADIYALGVTLYELLAGQPPFSLSGTSLPEALTMVRDTQPPSLSSIDRALRGDVTTIVRKAMEYDKQQRYQSALELANDIRRFLNREPISAHPPSAMYQIRAFARRNKALVSSVAVVFLILVVAVIAVTAALARSVRMEQQAITDRDRARKIAAFLKSTLVSANPMLGDAPEPSSADSQDAFSDVFGGQQWTSGSSANRNYSVGELMANAEKLLHRSFDDEPEIKAEIADTLGATMGALGLNAWPLQSEALEIRRRVLGERHPDTINSYVHVGSLLTGYGRAAEGEPFLRSAVDGLAASLGPVDPKTLAAALKLANNFVWQGRHEEAIALVRGNLDLAERTFGPDDPITLAHEQTLSILVMRVDLEESRALAQRSLDGLRRTLGEDSIPAADAMWSLAAVLRRQGSFIEAESLMRGAMAVYEKHFGPGTLRTLDLERELFEVLRRQHRIGDAAAVVRESLAKVRRAYDSAHHLTIRLEDRLARALLDEGVKIDEAEELSRHAADVGTQTLGELNVLTVLYRNTHAAALRRQGNTKEAEVEARKLVAANNEDLCVMCANQTLGECLIDKSRFEEAEQALRTAQQHATDQSDPYEPRLVALYRSWVRLYENWGKPDLAAPYRAKLTVIEAAAQR